MGLCLLQPALLVWFARPRCVGPVVSGPLRIRGCAERRGRDRDRV